MMDFVASLDLVPGVLAGEVHAIARLLTRCEAGTDECRTALEAIYRHAGRAHVVGITGVPGSGKSTLVAKLAVAIRRSDKVGHAIDLSSRFRRRHSGRPDPDGEVAGDAGSMSEDATAVRWGLRAGASEAVDVLDAAGFEMVLVETVGVGQDEVDIARAAHTTVVVSAPGLGDDIQAIKAGILEIADVHVVSKCDRPDADKAIADLKNMLALGLGSPRGGAWQFRSCRPRDCGARALRSSLRRSTAIARRSSRVAKSRRGGPRSTSGGCSRPARRSCVISSSAIVPAICRSCWRNWTSARFPRTRAQAPARADPDRR
jgi:LAO/AO transport system kinase